LSMTDCEVLRTTLLLSSLSRDSLLSLVRELVRNNMILLLPQQGMLSWLLMILILSPPLREEGHAVAEGVGL